MTHRRKKIGVIGAGFVGSTCAHWAAAKQLGDVVLLDVNEGVAKGKALDLYQSSPVEHFDSIVKGTNKYEDLKGADVVIITAGIPRKPGMSRDDLLKTNAGIMKQVCQGVKTHAPDSVVIVVSNPLDAMAYVAKDVLGFPRQRVLGMAGVLDGARMRTFIAEELQVSVKDVNAFVLGGHGDTMVPMPRHCSVGGIPLLEILPKEKVDAIVQRTRDGGAEIVKYLQTGSAYYAPAASAVQMAEAILLDQKRVLPCAAYLDGEYGIKGIFMGVLSKLGGNGLDKVYEIKLNDAEKADLNKSVEAVKGLVEALKKIEF